MNNKIYRYTDLTSLIHILVNKKLTLLNPSRWEDKNDVEVMDIYKKKKNLKSLTAICFAKSGETFHHWKIFSGSSAGVRLTFREDELIKSFSDIQGCRGGWINYLLIKENNVDLDDLPFIKRKPYASEKEYRIIWESRDVEREFFDVEINLSSIDSITLSPWINADVGESVKNILKRIEGCERIKIFRSTLVKNDQWIKRSHSIGISTSTDAKVM